LQQIILFVQSTLKYHNICAQLHVGIISSQIQHCKELQQDRKFVQRNRQNQKFHERSLFRSSNSEYQGLSRSKDLKPWENISSPFSSVSFASFQQTRPTQIMRSPRISGDLIGTHRVHHLQLQYGSRYQAERLRGQGEGLLQLAICQNCPNIEYISIDGNDKCQGHISGTALDTLKADKTLAKELRVLHLVDQSSYLEKAVKALSKARKRLEITVGETSKWGDGTITEYLGGKMDVNWSGFGGW
jgi:hypothetical protein